MLNQQKGFTLTESLIATAIVGILAAIAVPGYNYYVKTSQVSEGFRLMDAQRTNLDSIHRSGSCTAVAGVADTMKGKYGVLTVSGTYAPSAGASCPSGCNVTFRYNTTGLNKDIAGKVISAQLLNNGKLSKIVGSTSIPEKFLPKEFRAIGVDAGDVCTKVADDPLVPTTGTYPTGTETGAPPPPPPTPPSPPPTPPSPPVTPPTPPTPPVTPTTPPPPVTPPPTETGTPTPAPSPDPSCNRWQGEMTCADMGTWSCDVHNGDRRNGRSFYFQGEANNRNFLVPASQNMFSFVLRNGRCPATQAERESTAYNGVGVWCQAVDASKLQLNASCPAVNQKWNIFVGGIYDGLGLEWGTSQYLYPLNMNNADDRAYFNGESNEAIYKRIYYRTAYEWGGKNLKGGYIRVNGTGSQFDIGRVAHTTQAMTAFVLRNGRCPTPTDIATWAVPYTATTCMINQSLFTQYAAP